MIQFRVSKRWNQNPKQLAQAVALTLGFDPRVMVPFFREDKTFKESKQEWQLDSGNGWFLEKREEGLYELRYRYTTPKIQKVLESVIPFLEWRFQGAE